MMRFPWDWFRSDNGPTRGAFVLIGGEVTEFPYNHEGMTTARDISMQDVLAICNLLENGWYGQWTYIPTEEEKVLWLQALAWAGDDAYRWMVFTPGAVGRTNTQNGGYVHLRRCANRCLADRATWMQSELDVLRDPNRLLERELKNRDWYSHFSDDHRYWAAGNAQDGRLQLLYPHCNEETIRTLWAEHAPPDTVCPLDR